MSWQLYEGDVNAVPMEAVRLAARVTAPNVGPNLGGVRWSRGSRSAVEGGRNAGEGVDEALVKLEGRDGDDPSTVRLVETG